MPEVNGNVLMIAIKAVDIRIHALAEEVDNADGLVARDLEDLLLSYMETADALRKSYDEALRDSSNLPPYGELVREP